MEGERNMKKEVRRFDVKNIVLDTDENEKKRIIRGIIPFNSKSVNMGGMYEVISPTAFNKTLSDGAEVRALVNHDESKVLGSTKSGTLQLRVNEIGLEAEVDIPRTTYGNDVWEVIKRGDVTTLSFGFIPVKHQDAGNIRTLNEVKLLEVSYAVPYAAYPTTSSYTYLRSYVEENKIDYDQLDNVFSKIKENKLEENDKDILKTFVESLRTVYEEKIVDIVVAPVVVETQVKEDTTEKDKLLLNLEIEQLLL